MADIVIFSDQQQTATSFLGQNLRTIFGKSISVRTIDKNGLNHPSTWNVENTFLFIVPPIMGEDCDYNEVFTNKISRSEQAFIQKGGISWRICAGAYHAFKKIEYTSPTSGEFRQKESSTPLVAGLSFGPLPDLGMPIDPQNRYSDCIVTPVNCQIDDTSIEFGSCYGNGCSFKTDDPQVKILAQYAHDDELHPAIIERNIGQGMVIASGILPHYGHEDHTVEPLQALNAQLEPYESIRQHFMLALLGRMAEHAVKIGVISESDLASPLNALPKLQETQNDYRKETAMPLRNIACTT